MAKEKAKKEEEKKKNASTPCPKCYEGSGKMMGHRGRCTVCPPSEKVKKQKKQKEEKKETAETEFVECPKCVPGSGKPKGHRGSARAQESEEGGEEERDGPS